MDPFLTTYRQDYYTKKLTKLKKFSSKQEFRDPLSESFKKYLQLSNTEPPPDPPMQDADSYLEEYLSNHPKIKEMYYKTPIDNKTVAEAFIYNGRSVYQVDYCDLARDQAYAEEQRIKGLFRLPDDLNIPLTTYRYWYRNPIAINSQALKLRVPRRPVNNLGPEENLREIMKVTTGLTDYQGIIGTVGELVMKDELHGKMVHPPCTCFTHNPTRDPDQGE